MISPFHRCLPFPAVLVASAILATQAMGQTAQVSPAEDSGARASARVARSPMDPPYNAKCDATETAVLLNGVHQYTTVTGTDDTAAMAAWLNDLGTQTKLRGRTQLAVPVGVSGEQGPSTIFQRHGVMPENRGCRVHTMPYAPPAVRITGNNSTLYVDTAPGQGFVWMNHNDGNVSGNSNQTLEGVRVIYAGPPHASTGIGVGVIGGGFADIEGNTVAGFNVCGMLAGVEYSNVHKNQFAWCRAGIVQAPAIFNDATQTTEITSGGLPSLQNQISDNTFRNNDVNVICNGCHDSYLGPGSASFARVAGLIFGAVDFPYIDTLTLGNTSSAVCTASATIPLGFTDSAASLPAQGVLKTTAAGLPQSAYTYNGGKGYVSPTVSVPAPVSFTGTLSSGSNLVTVNSTAGLHQGWQIVGPGIPAATTVLRIAGATLALSAKATASGTGVRLAQAGCSRPPTVMAHVTSLKGILPFSGESIAGGGSGQNLVEFQNIENEGVDANGIAGRPSMGFQIIIGPSGSDNVFHRTVNGLEEGHFMRSEAMNVLVIDSLLSPLIDPGTGSTCPYMSLNSMEVRAPRQYSDPAELICDMEGHTDYSYKNAVLGWEGNLVKAHGLSAYGTSTGNAPLDVGVKFAVPGEVFPRLLCSIDGSCAIGNGSAAPDFQTGYLGDGKWGVRKGRIGNWPLSAACSKGTCSAVRVDPGNVEPTMLWSRASGTGDNFNAHLGAEINYTVGALSFTFRDCSSGTIPGTEVCASPYARLDKSGLTAAGVQLTSGQPALCDAAHRGGLYYAPGAHGVKDTVVICVKDAQDAYSFRPIY